MQIQFSTINYNKHIREGWTVRDIIEEMEDIVAMIMQGQSFKKPFRSKEELVLWLRDNYPGQVAPRKPKQAISEVEKHFCLQWGL